MRGIPTVVKWRYRNQNLVWSEWSDSVTFTIGKLLNNEECEVVDRSFRLYQNYPNPFNPNTNIVFNIPEFGKVSLAIYNVIGEKVATLIDRELEEGTHEIAFDGTKLSSGGIFLPA